MIKKLILIIMAAMLLTSCTAIERHFDKKNAVSLSFKSAAGYDYLKTINGKKVTINGYLATSSPADGSFIFLMNLPYQSCPFCVPNTQQLANTIEVYPKSGEKFDYTPQAVKVVGTLEVAKSESEPFTDTYGYEFNFKIVDATYTIIDESDLSPRMALWQKVADSGVVNELQSMYDYVNFTCKWNTYFVNSTTDASGNTTPGYFLYAEDAKYYITTDNAQWNYGYKENYFENIAKKLNAIDENEFKDIVENIYKAKALAGEAVSDLLAGKYSYETQYVEKFGTQDKIYTMERADYFEASFNTLFAEYSNWLGGWEL